MHETPAGPERVPAPRERRLLKTVLREAREHQRAGCPAEAIERFELAVSMAEARQDRRSLAEALRGLAVALHRGGDRERARLLGERSFIEAQAIGHLLLAAEALNSLGAMDLSVGALDDARTRFASALELAVTEPCLRARIEQNLGIVANIQGDFDEALLRYRRSLDAYRRCGDQHGLSLAHHNLGMACADRELYDEAERHFTRSREIAESLGDVHVRALCHVNQAEVDVARQRFEAAIDNAERALALFDQLREAAPKSSAYRVLGMAYRETGHLDLAESRLRSAIEIAARTCSVSNQAEATRELALLYGMQKRNGESLRQLTASYRLFRRLDARRDLIEAGAKIAELERAYVAVVREWAQSMESSDSVTYGHCERVAQLSVSMARVFGLDEQEEKTILMGAVLHDIGRVRAREPLSTGRSTQPPDDRDADRMHPLWGIELLESVDFPWDLKPIIRWHHERCDGSGYPDRLAGDEIPLGAQVVGIAEFYDTLITTADPALALTPAQAVDRIRQHRGWWADRVVQALVGVVSPTQAVA